MLVYEVVVKQARVVDQVRSLRARFCDLQFCFKGEEYRDILDRLRGLF
jgi:hypothetical protein